MTLHTPRNEQITGDDLSGNSGDANRTYVLTNSDAIAAMMKVMRAEAILQQGTGFTFDASTNTVTFVARTWDSQDISIDYLTSDTVTLSSSTYCTTLQIVRFGGLGIVIENENVGTGNDSETSFDLDNGNVIDSSYTIKHASSGSNSFSTLTETTHYTFDKDGGTLELTSAGVTALGTNVLYADYTHFPKQSDTILTTYLGPASREAERLTKNYWGPVKTGVELFDGYDSGYPRTDRPFGFQIADYPEFQLRNKSIQTIVSVVFLDKTGATASTVDSSNIRLIIEDEKHASRVLINASIPNGKANIKITHTHGYTQVPDMVQELTALVGAIMALVSISGGSFKDVASYQLGRKQFSVGEQYINLRESINQINARIDGLVNKKGNNYGCA